MSGGGRVWAQEKAKTKDDALESLLKELDEPEKAASKSDKPAKAAEPKAGLGRRPSKPAARARPPTRPGSDHRQGRQAIHAQIVRRGQGVAQGSSARRTARKTGRDQGRADARGSSQKWRPGGEPQPPSRGEKSGADKLGGKDKDLDERLEELTGRKKKRPLPIKSGAVRSAR